MLNRDDSIKAILIPTEPTELNRGEEWMERVEGKKEFVAMLSTCHTWPSARLTAFDAVSSL